jgi:hypothetical protein
VSFLHLASAIWPVVQPLASAASLAALIFRVARWTLRRSQGRRAGTPRIDPQLFPNRFQNGLSASSSTWPPREKAPFPGLLRADDGTRTHDLLHGKQTL